MSYRYWTEDEVQYLKAHFGQIRVVEIAQRLNRTEYAVMRKAENLGIRSRVPGSPVWANASDNLGPRRFREDHSAWRPPLVPWNQQGRMVIKRTDNGTPESYARYLVETEMGIELQSDQVVTYRDGNRLNCELSNLEIIDRVELARRNSIYRYPPEVVRTIRLLSKLKKTIEHAEEQID